MMDSGRRKAATSIQVEWADLPPELLGTISGGLGNPSEIVEFRSVCRSWRSSTLPLPNKLSVLFPCKRPTFFDEDPMISANAVYLLRPRSDPSQAWLVSVQEPAPGKLILRHALTLSYQEMNGDLDGDWIASTQILIAKFYALIELFRWCLGVYITQKVIFVGESGCGQLVVVGLFGYAPYGRIHAFRLDLGPNKCCLGATQVIGDFVKFNGRIFVVDKAGRIYVLDHTNLQPVQVTERHVGEYTRELTQIQFVVSDGDLYVVWISYIDNQYPSESEIYRLKVVVTYLVGYLY